MPKELESAIAVLERYGYKAEADAVKAAANSAAELVAAREQIARLTAPQI